VTRYTVTLADDSTCQVDADGLDVNDGVLVFSVRDDEPPVAMRPIFAVHFRAWKTVQAADAGVSFSSAQWGGQQQQPEPPKPSRVLPATLQPDPLQRSGW
jgi:hypothetical protein